MTWNTHNGTWGSGMVRAFYPASMGGPLGRPGQQLPDFNSNPAYNTERMLSSSTPYTGSGMVLRRMRFGGGRSVTPGGMGVSPSWGLTHKFSSRKVRRKARKSRRKTRKSRRKSRSKASRRSFGFGACMKCMA